MSSESKVLDTSQQSAVDNISELTHSTMLLIGAGGSGKTFTIQHLLTQLWNDGRNSIRNNNTFLTAPTGKAAKVINDAFEKDNFDCFNEAKTIHRLLKFNPTLGWGLGVDENLDASLVIVDEASMVDSVLLSKIILALPASCFLILVGDDNQLPPVAPGQPFTDLINYGPVDMVNRLTTNHRQAQGSLIANACLSVLDGEYPVFGKPGENTLGGTISDDLFLNEQDDKEIIPDVVVEICHAWHENKLDYAILSPQKTGVCGVESLNKYLQERLNPEHPDKEQVKVAWLMFREGDKVLQTKNNYQLGVFNGFTGFIVKIHEEQITVDFDGQIVLYQNSSEIKQLTLGYCMTIHKSQGSQFQYGVLVCHSSHYYMWSRSILYTGVSRYRQELHVVGDRKAIKRGLSNVVSGERNTHMKLQLVLET